MKTLALKTLLTMTMVILGMTFAVTASADQRFENWQGICHFAYDEDDEDNEVYFANCLNTIDTYDAGDDNGRLAYGSSLVKQKYDPSRNTYPKVIVNGGDIVKLKGDASTVGNDNFTVQANTACVMVTSNYDADADDNNETVYTTNDWDLIISTNRRKNEDNDDLPGTLRVTYKLNCRAGTQQ